MSAVVFRVGMGDVLTATLVLRWMVLYDHLTAGAAATW
jgi:hypothetical protein